MVLSYIIKGRDGRWHVISSLQLITAAVLNKIKQYGCKEVAIRESEKIPEKEAKIMNVEEIKALSLGMYSTPAFNY